MMAVLVGWLGSAMVCVGYSFAIRELTGSAEKFNHLFQSFD
jgi:hypothetical protein